MKPSSRTSQVVPILCLLLAAAASAAFGSPAGAPAAKRTHRTRSTAFNLDPAKFDATSYDDAIVRQVAIDALGHTNGSVVALDPATGRILTIVNQKMAFSAGFEPCSTIKPVIALAGLQEGAITRDTMLKVDRRRYMDLTEAMAHSNNVFFESVGKQLGFDTVIKYARLLGLGERVGYNISEEQPGSLPLFPPKYGGVARMSSFGGGIRITPLQLASLAATLANGGTEYYLQYPRTTEDRVNFAPRVRRQLDIAPLLPDIREGMLAAVMYGTARRSYDPLWQRHPRSYARQNGHLQRRIARRPARLVRFLRRRNSSENCSRDSHSRRRPQHQRPARFPDCRPHLPRASRAKLFRNIRFRARFAIRRRRLRRRFSLTASSARPHSISRGTARRARCRRQGNRATRPRVGSLRVNS